MYGGDTPTGVWFGGLTVFMIGLEVGIFGWFGNYGLHLHTAGPETRRTPLVRYNTGRGMEGWGKPHPTGD